MKIPNVTIQQLLEAGVHLGHKTLRWNPKMKNYIFGKRDSIHIIDLTQTLELTNSALEKVYNTILNNEKILFVSTKKQASEAIAELAKETDQYFVNYRWLGGMLTNWGTISNSIKKLKKIESDLVSENRGFTKKELLKMSVKRDKLERSLGGISEMKKIPDLVFVIDTNYESLAIKESIKLGIPIVAILDKICEEKLEPFIESSYQELADYVSAYDQKMQMKRENIADRGIWTAKKRYILNVWDSEGVRYKEPKMKIMGLETARSSTPAYFRDKLYAAFKIIIGKTNDELINFINVVRTETRERPYNEVAFPRGVNNLAKYRHPNEIYQKGTPIAVRGALLYNYYVKKHDIENKHPLIQEGEKIKFMYLRTPNPLHENVVSFFGDLPKEFGLENYVDYQTQFEKSFLEPLKNVLQCIGWSHKKSVSIGSFFE